MDFFFYGTFRHAKLLSLVLSREVEGEEATLDGFAVHAAQGYSFPMLVSDPAAVTHGILVRGMSNQDVARIDFYEGGQFFHTRIKKVRTGGAEVEARVYFPDPGQWVAGGPWVFEDWLATWGELVQSTAGDVMSLYGSVTPVAVRARYDQMLVRGSSRVRAVGDTPATLRHDATVADLRIAEFRQPYANFFAIEEYDLAWRRFDGAMGPVTTRAVFISGDAVTVLPYDPVRDLVLLIEQFRAGPMARGDLQPWLLEAIAGRIDPGEAPEDAARREAREEAGLELAGLLPVGGYYPSPGAKSEYLYSYVALVDLPDDAAGIFGVAEEVEDIRGHLIPFERMMELVATGEINNGPLLVTALWLQRERARLRAAAGS